MKVFFIPGLGYDGRIFDQLDLGKLQRHYIKWIDPLTRESFSAYAKRVGEQILTEKEKVSIIGHSLGGLIAQELATLRSVEKVIIISSIKSQAEMPFHFKVVPTFGLHKFFTKELSLKTIKYWGKNHGFNTPKDQALFKSMVGAQSNKYLQWALHQVCTWKQTDLPASTKVFHLHGTKDKTFPIKNIVQPCEIINSGDHLMVYQQAHILSPIISKALET